jgi:rhamnose utilization protein RhaD (predicted bifunctional aldolase and dehydrogenase)
VVQQHSPVHAPDQVSDELLALTHSLGRPERDLVILAEGNTSQQLDGGRIAVKASGSNMATATKDDFVVLDVAATAPLLTDSGATQADLTAALDAGEVGGRRLRGSIEALVHVAVQAVAGPAGLADAARFVGHTHPTAVVGLLASVRAAESYQRIVYSDEAVVIGASPLFVPYAQPGIALGHAFHAALAERVQQTGELPQLVLLGNHGIVAIAPTADGVDGISAMAVKGAQVRTAAYAVGGIAPLTDEQVAKFFARDDIAERRDKLARGTF